MTERVLLEFERDLLLLCKKYDVLISRDETRRSSLKPDAIYFRDFTVSAKVAPKWEDITEEKKH